MKKLFLIIRNAIEVILPVATFTIMFLTFILQVFFRYVINHPLTWTQEVIVVTFVWTVLLGTCFTMRRHAHVKFTLIYDKLNPQIAALFRMIGNLLIIITFVLLVIPSFKYTSFVAFQKTAVFRISYRWVFLPFVYFVISTIGYIGSEIKEDLLVITKKIGDSEDHRNGGLLS